MPANKHQGLNACLCLLPKNVNNFVELNIRSAHHMNHRSSSSSSSFEEVSTPGQRQSRLGPRVYLFTTPGCCTAWIRYWKWCYLASIVFRHPKPSDLFLHVVPDVQGTLLEHGLRFVQRRHIRNSVKKRDPISAWTNGIAQHQSAAV